MQTKAFAVNESNPAMRVQEYCKETFINYRTSTCTLHSMQSAIFFLPFLSTHLVLVLCDVSSDLFHRLVAVFQVTYSSPY